MGDKDNAGGSGKALTETLRKSFDWADAAKMGIAESGLLERIPLMGWVASAARGVFAVRDQLLLKKIMLFLEPIGELDEKEKSKWADELDQDPDERERVGEQLMLILDRQDDPRKARILGVIWKARLQERITQPILELLSAALDRIYLPHLRVLSDLNDTIKRERDKKRKHPGEDWDASKNFESVPIQDLRNAGLVVMPNEGGFKELGDPRYAPSELAYWLLTVVPLDELPN